MWENGIDGTFLPIITTINLGHYVLNKMSLTGEEKRDLLELSGNKEQNGNEFPRGFFAPHIPDLELAKPGDLDADG